MLLGPWPTIVRGSWLEARVTRDGLLGGASRQARLQTCAGKRADLCGQARGKWWVRWRFSFGCTAHEKAQACVAQCGQGRLVRCPRGSTAADALARTGDAAWYEKTSGTGRFRTAIPDDAACAGAASAAANAAANAAAQRSSSRCCPSGARTERLKVGDERVVVAVRRIDVDPRAAHGEAAQKERVRPAVVDAVDGLPDVRRV